MSKWTITLPCEVGDKLYRPWYCSKTIDEYEIVEIKLRKDNVIFKAVHYKYNRLDNEMLVYLWQLGKKAFLNKEEAEAAINA